MHQRPQTELLMVDGWCTARKVPKLVAGRVLREVKSGMPASGTYQDSLSAIDEASHEAHNVVGGLPIKTRGWLVQEEQSRFGHELDAQCHTLPLLNAETGSRNYWEVSTFRDPGTWKICQ